MWILTPSITSAFAAATGELTSASSEQLAAAFARSLLSRSKPSPQRTWLQRLKRDSWTTHLSGAISSDSLGESFTDWWTSSLAATRANPSAQPANASEPKTHDTSGLTYQPELLQCDQQSAFLRMSKDTFLSGCATCCKTWSDWVTERRGAWRQRVNAARLTRGSGSSSWPTIRASEYKDVGPVGSKSHDHMLGKHYLCAVVTQEETNWLTAQVTDSMGACLTEKRLCRPKGTQLREAVHGQAAQASSNTRGSRQGLWPTPCANNPNEGETLESWDRRQALNKAKHNNGNGAGTPLAIKVKQELWPTARSLDGSVNESLETWTARHHRKEVGQATLAEFVHAKHKKGDLWSTPRTGATESSRPNNKGGIPLADQAKREQWATPRTPTGGPESAQRKQELGRTTSGGGDLASQAMTQWGSPRTGIRGDTHFSYDRGKHNIEEQAGASMKGGGKLNPRWVETLMGLPIGWTMPSCIRPVTTAPTSCDSSETALCRPAQSERSDFFLASCGKEPTK
jgi:hypothetical protein